MISMPEGHLIQQSIMSTKKASKGDRIVEFDISLQIDDVECTIYDQQEDTWKPVYGKVRTLLWDVSRSAKCGSHYAVRNSANCRAKSNCVLP